jgi:hypothetical protein
VKVPSIEQRRQKEFEIELLERARAWIPQWALADDESDFGRALLKIAARFNSEVAERLNRCGEKTQRGFLDWLGVRGIAARPARMPVVLKLADNAPDPVLAVAPVRMQADTEDTPVVFETETDVCLLPGQLQAVVACDGTEDAFYLPPPGLSNLKPLEPLPSQWQLKSFVAAGAKKLQLDPETGLVPDMIVEAAGAQYKITQVEKDIVTIEPPLAGGLASGQLVNKVTTFEPFDGAAHNWQEHALYFGDADLLNIEAEAKIEIVGATGLPADVAWEYWGKLDPGADVGWKPLKLSDQKAVVLGKPKGSVEKYEIDGKSSRWIRAYTKKVTDGPFSTDSELGLRINSSNCGTKLTDLKCSDAEKVASPAAEAMANTTPLVLDTPFFPLGKEPKQFDAFYLGSQEAFSKKEAEVQLCFQMADLRFTVLSTVLGSNVLAGVGADGALHLLQFDSINRTLKKLRDREPLRPPTPGFNGIALPITNPVQLDSAPSWRLPIWTEFTGAFTGLDLDLVVAMSAGTDIWAWRESGFLPANGITNATAPNNSGWTYLGQVTPPPPPSGTPPKVEGLVYLHDAAHSQIAALYNDVLYIRGWPNGTWQKVDTVASGSSNVLAFKSIVPVLVDSSGYLLTSLADGMVGVTASGDVYQVQLTLGTTVTSTCTKRASGFSADVRPAAVRDSASNLVVVGVDKAVPSRLVAYWQGAGAISPQDIPSGGKVAVGIDVLLDGSKLYFLGAAKTPGNSLIIWGPFDSSGSGQLVESEIPSSVGQAAGAPTALVSDVVIPGASADLLVTDFDVTRQKIRKGTIQPGVVVPSSTPQLFALDVIAREGSTPPESHSVTDSGLTEAGETFYPLDNDFATTTGQLWAFIKSTKFAGSFVDSTHFTLNASDREGTPDEWLLIGTELFQVKSVKPSNHWVIEIDPPSSSTPASIDYIRPLAIDGRVAPYMHLDSTNGDWDADLLQRSKLVFPGQDPPEQTGKAFKHLGSQPIIVVLGGLFASSLAGTQVTFVVNVAAGNWSRFLGDTSTSPELSWEYWNGKGWWKLPIKSDATFNLKSSGALAFEIPDNIAASDWSGKTNFWIRARLVGGDYGKEKVTITTTAVSSTVSQQTVDRSSEGIQAPQVVKLNIFYRICKPSIPTHVLSQDSGSIRDQSDANRTGGAIVEAFVPLGVMLGRLSRTTADVKTPAEAPPECGCTSQRTTATTSSPANTSAVDTGAAPQDTGRSIFLGFDKPLSQQPVNVLLLVEQERDHGQFAPMRVQALIGNTLVPIVANDTTRALGESGLLSMSFSVGPTSRDLFGQSLYWLRLTPADTGPATDWKPTVRGAYLNAVWASATETMTRELVGSSEGAPNLTLKLARPPVLDKTLELRVREPLGEEARAALLKEDKDSVQSSVEGLPGDWVLWKQVTDPTDEASNARVYALDESNGEISFGDGQHGAIPPIGADSIVAFSYKRTEPGKPGSTDAPANTIGPRAQLGLVSPVSSVEAAFAADQAAGGAPPEPPERVVRFGAARLRHRERAVTARDLEDLTLESSPKVAQARCILRPSYVKLVVVMRGANSSPSAAEVRELRRLLLAAAPAGLGVASALRIQGPDVRTLRIKLNLTIADLDYSGEVARDAKQRVRDLFDVATGGISKNGWQLGENPEESDIAYVLSDAPKLDGIQEIQRYEVDKDGNERAWPASLKATELVMLSDDPVRIDFTVVEVVA